MTAFARKVLGGLPDADHAPAPRTTTRSLQEFTNDSDKAGGKVDLQVSPTLSLFGRYGWRDLDDLRPAADSAAVGRRRQRQHLRAQQAARARRDLHAERAARCSKCASAGRTRRPARTRRRSAATARSTRSASPGCRPIRASPAACRRSLITGYSDLGRQATNPQWQYPTVWNPKVNYTWLRGPALAQDRLRVPAHRRRGAGRQPALRPRHLQPASSRGRPAPRAEQPLQPRRLHARPALAVRAQQRAGRATCASNMHFAYLQDDCPRQRPADAEPRPALRVRDADVGSATTSCRTSIRRRSTMVSATDGSIADRALVNPDRNNFGPRLGFAYTPMAEDRRPRRLGHQLRALQPRRRRRTCCRSTARR